MNMFARGLAAAAAFSFASFPALAETAEINFGIISTESQQNLKQNWEPFLAEMAKDTGIKITPFFASDYAGIIEAQKFNKVQMAWYGNKSAMEAVDRADGQVFAQSVDAEGNPGYWSLVIAHKDSAITSVDDVMKCDKSLSFGNGDPNSTSGFLVPSVYLFSAKGVEPKDCFRAVTNANHETNLMAVVNKQVDIATNNTESLRNFAKKDPAAAAMVKEVWRSPLIPSDPIVWRKDLDDEAKAKIMTFFMTYGRQGTPDEVKAERAILKALGWAPFKPSSDAQLYPIRVMEISKAINKLKADEALAAGDKEAQLKELMAKKAEYEGLMAEEPQT
jgi:phosphonate transport system substrate-binding protein